MKNTTSKFGFEQMKVLLFACAVLLAATASAHAATAVDIYQDMAGGHDGDLLTPTIINMSAHPGTFGWGIKNGPWFVSSKYARSLPGSVTAGGVTYTGAGNNSWMYSDSNAMNYVNVYLGKGGPYTAITVAFYYTTERKAWPRNYHIYDTISVLGRAHTFGCMQTINQGGTNGVYGKGPYLRAHSKDKTAHSTFSSTVIPIVAGKTYWVNLNYSAAGAGAVSLAAFDPDNGFAQVGSTAVAESCPDTVGWNVMIGRADNDGNEPADAERSWVSQIMVDFTRAAFPLVPSADTNGLPPGAKEAK